MKIPEETMNTVTNTFTDKQIKWVSIVLQDENGVIQKRVSFDMVEWCELTTQIPAYYISEYMEKHWKTLPTTYELDLQSYEPKPVYEKLMSIHVESADPEQVQIRVGVNDQQDVKILCDSWNDYQTSWGYEQEQHDQPFGTVDLWSFGRVEATVFQHTTEPSHTHVCAIPDCDETVTIDGHTRELVHYCENCERDSYFEYDR